MQGENKTKKNTNTVFRLLQRPRGSAFQKDTPGLSMPILCDFWWSYFRCLAEAVFQERESVRQGMSIFLMAPCSKHRRKQSSLFPLGTITAWFQEASQDEFSTPVKSGWLSVKLRVFQYNSTETLSEQLYLLRVYVCFQTSCITPICYCMDAARITRKGTCLLPIFCVFPSITFKEVL